MDQYFKLQNGSDVRGAVPEEEGNVGQAVPVAGASGTHALH